MLCCLLVNLALGKPRQEDCQDYDTIFGYGVRPHLNISHPLEKKSFFSFKVELAAWNSVCGLVICTL